MKADIHPNYQPCKVECNCGNTFVTASSKPAIRVEICNVCHPFYTGAVRLMDTEGRIEKFKKKYARAAAK